MKVIEIQELIDLITKSKLEEVNIETEAIKIHVKRSIMPGQQVAPVLPNMFSPAPAHLPSAAPVSTIAMSPTETNLVETDTVPITSPMIGTFYRSPNPDAPPFVQVGDMVKPGTKLCIIEAMKLYNEIEAEVSGKIVKILVDDVSPVEFDQPLFLIEPA